MPLLCLPAYDVTGLSHEPSCSGTVLLAGVPSTGSGAHLEGRGLFRLQHLAPGVGRLHGTLPCHAVVAAHRLCYDLLQPAGGTSEPAGDCGAAIGRLQALVKGSERYGKAMKSSTRYDSEL